MTTRAPTAQLGIVVGMTEPSDEELLAAWGAGDDSAAAGLIDRHFEDLYRFFAGKVGDEAEELIQATLVGCLENRGTHSEIRSFRAYLFGVARNRLFDHFRRQRKAEAVDPLESSLADLQTPASERIARNEEERFVLEALRRIPLESQLLIELYYWQSLSGPELAHVFEIPEGTLRGRLRRAKDLLREQVDHVTRTGIALDDTLTRLADWKHRPAEP